MKKPEIPAYFKTLFDRYQYILLVCLLGVILLLWPEGQETKTVTDERGAQTDTGYLEERIRAVLEEAEGVGQAHVLLTLDCGEETEYVFDRSDTDDRSESRYNVSHQAELVTVSDSGGQSPVTLRVWAPRYRGAVVVCQGGDRAGVRLKVTEIVSSLTGLSADKIVISKMK